MPRTSGSATARGGFANEKQIANAFNAGNSLAKKCFAYLKIADTAKVTARTIPSPLGVACLKEILKLASDPTPDQVKTIKKQQKADVRLTVHHEHHTEAINLTLKRAGKADFNQVDRRSVSTYQDLWGFDDEIQLWLRLFTGAVSTDEFNRWSEGLETKPTQKRVGFRHLPDHAKLKVIDFFSANKQRIVSDVVRGNGLLAADYMIVTQYTVKKTQIHLCPIDNVVRHLSSGAVQAGPQTTLLLGKLTIKRKGGKPDPDSLQFMMKPSDVFAVDGLTLQVIDPARRK
jgi:hypothetical protein